MGYDLMGIELVAYPDVALVIDQTEFSESLFALGIRFPDCLTLSRSSFFILKSITTRSAPVPLPTTLLSVFMDG